MRLTHTVGKTLALSMAGYFSANLQAATECPHPAISDRPSIGLALGGGGARGYAHIGVIEVLEEMRIPVDYVAGTSMGSIIGALYASGMDAQEMNTTIAALDWGELFNDSTARPDETFRRKRDDDLSLHGPTLGLGKNVSLLPKGALGGQKIVFLFEGLVNQRFYGTDFNQLALPYRAIAADIITGEEVIMAQGNVALAMRASMSVPAIFDPVEIGDKMLVDGGVVNNLPIDVVQDMGADIVIAIDVGTPLSGRDELNNLLSITAQLSGMLVRKNTDEQIARLRSSDLLISPALGSDIGAGDFEMLEEAVPIGRSAALTMEDKLRSLSVSEAEYAAYKATLASCLVSVPVVNFVRLDNQSRFSDEVIERKINVQVGQALDKPALEYDLSQIYTLGYLKSASYQLVTEDGHAGVVITVLPDERGHNMLQTGLEISADGERLTSSITLAYLKNNIDELGTELRLGAVMGNDPELFAELYKPLDIDLKYIALSQIALTSDLVGNFDKDGNVVSETRLRQANLQLGFGREIGRMGLISAGIRFGTGDTEIEVGNPAIPSSSFDRGEYFASLRYDRIDDRYFPSSGSFLVVEYLNSQDSLGADQEFEQISIDGFSNWSWNRHTILAGFRYHATLDGEAPIYGIFRAGGLSRMSGYAPNELNGQNFGLILAGYRYEAFKTGFLPAYIGGTLEYGNVAADRNDIFDEGILNGSIYLGYQSPIGPLYLGYGWAEGGRNLIFLKLGTVFGK